MDNLTTKMVYVPVDNTSGFIIENREDWSRRFANKLPDRIVLKPAELVLLLAEYKEGPFGLTEFCNHKGIDI